MNIIEAGAFTVTTGIYNRKQHVFVTHAATGKQWVSKDPYDGRPLDDNGGFTLAEQIRAGIIQFHLTGVDARSRKSRLTCDTRFWSPVYPKVPVRDNRETEFARLCFD